MKKLLFSLVALVCSMSINAQVVKLYKGDKLVAAYKDYMVDKVVFEEAPASTTTGTAKATIDGKEVDVTWIQLWENGPKFAENDVAVSMTYTDAVKTGANYIWGANWCTPSKGELDELMKAATSEGSTKVTCEYVKEGDSYGFKFTGKEEDYIANSVFFPISSGDSDNGYVALWSSTANGTTSYMMRLVYFDGYYSRWDTYVSTSMGRVRPVLKE